MSCGVIVASESEAAVLELSFQLGGGWAYPYSARWLTSRSLTRIAASLGKVYMHLWISVDRGRRAENSLETMNNYYSTLRTIYTATVLPS
jgi:hypothetical protein